MQAEKDFDTLSALVGALLGAYECGRLVTPQGILVTKGTWWTPPTLVDYLRTTPMSDFPDVAGKDPAWTNFEFLESYFSNFEEGTRFIASRRLCVWQ